MVEGRRFFASIVLPVIEGRRSIEIKSSGHSTETPVARAAVSFGKLHPVKVRDRVNSVHSYVNSVAKQPQRTHAPGCDRRA